MYSRKVDENECSRHEITDERTAFLICKILNIKVTSYQVAGNFSLKGDSMNSDLSRSDDGDLTTKSSLEHQHKPGLMLVKKSTAINLTKPKRKT